MFKRGSVRPNLPGVVKAVDVNESERFGGFSECRPGGEEGGRDGLGREEETDEDGGGEEDVEEEQEAGLVNKNGRIKPACPCDPNVWPPGGPGHWTR